MHAHNEQFGMGSSPYHTDARTREITNSQATLVVLAYCRECTIYTCEKSAQAIAK